MAGDTIDGDDETVRKPPAKGNFLSRSLSKRLLALAAISVLTAEILLLIPLLADYRVNWLKERLDEAAIVGLATEGAVGVGAEGTMPADQQRMLLDALGVRLVAVDNGRANRLIARDLSLRSVTRTIHLGEESFTQKIARALDGIVFGGERTLRVLGTTHEEQSLEIEVVVDDQALRGAMFAFASRTIAISLVIALTTGLFLWAVVDRMMIAPIRRMTDAMVRFGNEPSDPGRVIRPSDRADELGVAERELAEMQAKLAETLKEQRRLANLGLAVSKINHDMRNILASSQMISDRLASLPDPKVQRMAPMLLRSLDRALHYTQTVLAYGRAGERAPERRRIDLHATVVDVCDLLALGSEDTRIEFVNAVPKGFEVMADPEQIHRLLTNLCRNAVQAMVSDGKTGVGIVHRLTVGAERRSPGAATIFVEDTGPGLPQKARDNLFQAFTGSARSGGTGLGLAIGREIVEAHEGDLRLVDTGATGTRFEIDLPDSLNRAPRSADT